MSEEAVEQSIGERIREAFDGLDIKSAMRIAFGKCPHCGVRMVRGYWLRWCADRTCVGYHEALNKELAAKIESIKPVGEQEKAVTKRLAEMLE